MRWLVGTLFRDASWKAHDDSKNESLTQSLTEKYCCLTAEATASTCERSLLLSVHSLLLPSPKSQMTQASKVQIQRLPSTGSAEVKFNFAYINGSDSTSKSVSPSPSMGPGHAPLTAVCKAAHGFGLLNPDNVPWWSRWKIHAILYGDLNDDHDDLYSMDDLIPMILMIMIMLMKIIDDNDPKHIPTRPYWELIYILASAREVAGFHPEYQCVQIWLVGPVLALWTDAQDFSTNSSRRWSRLFMQEWAHTTHAT